MHSLVWGIFNLFKSMLGETGAKIISSTGVILAPCSPLSLSHKCHLSFAGVSVLAFALCFPNCVRCI